MQNSHEAVWFWQQRLLIGSEHCQQYSPSPSLPGTFCRHLPQQSPAERRMRSDLITALRMSSCWLTSPWFTETSSSSLQKGRKGHRKSADVVYCGVFSWLRLPERGEGILMLHLGTDASRRMTHSQAFLGLHFLACIKQCGFE